MDLSEFGEQSGIANRQNKAKQKIIKKYLTFKLQESSTTIELKTTKDGWLALQADISLGSKKFKEFLNYVLLEINPVSKRYDKQEFKHHVVSTFAYCYCCLTKGHNLWPEHFRQLLKLFENENLDLVGIKSKSDKDRHNWAIKLSIFSIYGIKPDSTHSSYMGIGPYLILRDSFNYEVFRQQYITNENLLVIKAKRIADELLGQQSFGNVHDVNNKPCDSEEIEPTAGPSKLLICLIQDRLSKQ